MQELQHKLFLRFCTWLSGAFSELKMGVFSNEVSPEITKNRDPCLIFQMELAGKLAEDGHLICGDNLVEVKLV